MDKQQMEKQEEEDEKVNWLDLPDHLIASITDKIYLMKDYISFGAVCRSWRSVYTNNLDRDCQHRRLPLLMVPPRIGSKEHEEDNGRTLKVYSLSDNAVLPNIKLRVPHDRYCSGSSEGWLITLHDKLTHVCLLHPFSGAEIELPLLKDLPHEEGEIHEGFLHKAILSADPSLNPNYVVMVIYGKLYRLALFKPGEPTWTPLDFLFTYMNDIIYWRDRFYAVDWRGQTYTCDPNHPNPLQPIKVAQPGIEKYLLGGKKYLVVSDGELFLIARSRSSNKANEYYWTDSFEVFKLKQGSSPTTSTWTRLKSLGGQALFLGSNSSLSLLASDFPGCRPDCIYFTDDFEWFYRLEDIARVFENRAPGIGHWNLDLGVYNLADGTFDQLFPVKFNFTFPSPIWIQQSLPKQQHSRD